MNKQTTTTQTNTDSPIKLGSTVKDNKNGFQGIVHGLFPNFWKSIPMTSVKAREWLGYQLHPFTDDQVNRERWYYVRCHNDGGYFYTCESRLTVLAPPSHNPDPSKGPLQPWSIWAKIVAIESATGSTCLYLDDRVKIWRGELPLLFLDSATYKPEVEDLVEGNSAQIFIYRNNEVYEFIRKDDSLIQIA